eukprot:m.216831 g.216831  ORF g.216831 m.216831 type:complete len:545 (+) comp15594_c2_seq2:570-2204(+)
MATSSAGWTESVYHIAPRAQHGALGLAETTVDAVPGMAVAPCYDTATAGGSDWDGQVYDIYPAFSAEPARSLASSHGSPSLLFRGAPPAMRSGSTAPPGRAGPGDKEAEPSGERTSRKRILGFVLFIALALAGIAIAVVALNRPSSSSGAPAADPAVAGQASTAASLAASNANITQGLLQRVEVLERTVNGQATVIAELNATLNDTRAELMRTTAALADEQARSSLINSTLTTALATEQARAMAAEAALAASSSQAQQNDSSLLMLIQAEASRAVGVENQLNVSMNNEVSRAIQVENSLSVGAGSINNTINAFFPIIGGTLSSDAMYYYRTFTSSGFLTVNLAAQPLNADVLLVGGGGAGGFGFGAGGGGGSVLYRANFSIPTGTYPITVGAGAPAITANPTVAPPSGGATIAFGVTATGGGYGGTESNTVQSGNSDFPAGGPGGNSGGGNYGSFTGGTATAPVAPGWSVYAGNRGAAGGTNGGSCPCGGGGGAGGPAPAITNPTSGPSGPGGPGVLIPGALGGNFYWGGGGGGAVVGGRWKFN